MSNKKLDDYDITILKVLQNDNTTSQRTIAGLVNLSSSAVQRRIQRMNQDGIIKSNTSQIDPAEAGYPINLIVQVELYNDYISERDKIKAFFAAQDSIQQCYYVAGEFDFVLIMNVASMEDYKLLSKELFMDNKYVKNHTTILTLDRVKVNLHVPL